MPTEILMPALSPTMEEGKLAKWLVKEGQTVKAGDIIAEIETDKATMEVEAVDEGKVGKLLVSEGTEGVKVNTPIATLLAEGESAGAAPAAKALQPQAAAPQAHRRSRQRLSAGVSRRRRAQPARWAGRSSRAATPLPSRTRKGQASPRRQPAAPQRPRPHFCFALGAAAGQGGGARLGGAHRLRSAWPRRQARRGDGGCRTAARARSRGPAPRLQPSPARRALTPQPMPDDKVLALYEKGSYEVIPHDNMRRVIAQRLTQSKQTIPHFHLSVDCRLDELLRARERMNAVSPKDGPRAYKLSVNDFVIKALALALQQVPAANVTWTEAGTLRHKYSDIGVAVAIEGGLFTPIIRHAELKSLSEISNEMRDLAERARKRRLAPHEYQGGTTSISNLGMYGIKSFDAVINPPHATILAVGMGEKRPVVSGDKVEVATLVTCTLSCDHRVVDGAVGAELLNAFKMLVEDPVRMLV